jgi:hypothetical protein
LLRKIGKMRGEKKRKRKFDKKVSKLKSFAVKELELSSS